MKHQYLAVLGVASFLSIAACHKAVPVAAAKPVQPPVQVETPPPAQRAALTPREPAPAPAKAKPVQTAAAPAKMPPEVRIDINARLAKLEDALFDYDKATIREDATSALRGDVGVIRDILAGYPAQKLLIEGHADERGSAEYNLALGDKRASSAEEFLANMGIPRSQLTIISYGKEKPQCTEQSENCWQKNRRAHITAAP